MSKKPSPTEPSIADNGERRVAGKGDRTRGPQFDLWLEEKLRTAYSSVLEEPIPEELLRLLEETLKD